MNVIKPGKLQDKPYKPIREGDPQEIINICLECHVEGGCRSDAKECPLNTEALKVTAKRAKSERDEKILELLNKGLSYREIGRKLGITHSTVIATRNRLIKDGKLKGSEIK